MVPNFVIFFLMHPEDKLDYQEKEFMHIKSTPIHGILGKPCMDKNRRR